MALISRHGTVGQRGLLSTPLNRETTGRFGRMFRDLPPCNLLADDLLALGEFMVKPAEPDKAFGATDDDENPRIPAGYTYFGQFIDHDLTHDPASVLDREQDPEGLVDFRTPRFDLDSLYGTGPDEQPFLYQADGLKLATGGEIRFPLPTADTTAGDVRGDGQADLPRSAAEVALIGDPRNDENMIVAQIHAAFIAFHNKRVDDLATELKGLRPAEKFFRVTTDVRWHYQYLVLNDFLPRIVGDEFLQKLLAPVAGGGAPALQFYGVDRDGYPFMPVEFAVAAYRLGHSMVRPSYRLNDQHPGFTIEGSNAGRISIFTKDGVLAGTNVRNDLRGFEAIAGGAAPRSSWGIEWKYFFEVGGKKAPDGTSNDRLSIITDPAQPASPADGPQRSYRIDASLVDPLRELPGAPPAELPDITGKRPTLNSLAQRNLLRGRALKLPSGQSAALATGEEPLSKAQLTKTETPPSTVEAAMLKRVAADTPLWFYILKEAEVLHNGQHLGPVGARIVGETFVGLLWNDPRSFLRAQSWWKPSPQVAPSGRFGMQDFMAYALGLANPRPRSTPDPAA